MFRQVTCAALLIVAASGAAIAQDADGVAGRPALSTKSTSDLISQREKWGTKPAKSSAPAAAAAGAAAAAKAAAPAKGAAPAKPAAAAPVVTPDRYTDLPTDSTKNLISEREKWGKGPAGYETKKVVAPPAAGAKPSKLKAAVEKVKKKLKKKKN